MKRNKIMATENKYAGNNKLITAEGNEELNKDTWDVRVLGITYIYTRNDFHLTFKNIDIQLRPLLKKYVIDRLFTKNSISWQTARNDVFHLRKFFEFFCLKYPELNHLKNLERGDIEEYYIFLKESKLGGNDTKYKGKPSSDYYLWRMIGILETFLTYIQRYEWEEAPLKGIRNLIYQEDRPIVKNKKIEEYEIITDFIWAQVIDNLDKMIPHYIPILLILESTGLNLNDVLTLDLDCLHETSEGFRVKVTKRIVKNHSIPVSNDIAEIIKHQRKIIKTRFPVEMNPRNLLFLKTSGKAPGKPYLYISFYRQLNNFSKDNNIKDEMGNSAHFNSRAFRNRFGINQLASGKSVPEVQKLFATVTPYLAMICAQIKDRDLDKKWEETKEMYGLRLNPLTGETITTFLENMADEQGINQEWLRRNHESLKMEHGYCVRPSQSHCQYIHQLIEMPCIHHKCQSFYVDSSFLHYYLDQISKMEIEIERYKNMGRYRSAEILEPRLFKYREILKKIQGIS
ncbi:tyrosine-type recombinase/integrase [Paenibacillus eucommiae]|uniref:Integrase n=1 Tax=Paenibacillus eucommiae TaxID=1355755 RepID=A0ABS4IUD3_9BACL|nr:tyrosine-type recombinase/integrase [Paenibacillus eucommiae]MBP1991193.1 integrase [Paenibacillus eucommiae]